MTHKYAITVVKTTLPKTKDHYYDYLDSIDSMGFLGNVYFEETKGLHIHFLMKTGIRLDYKQLYPKKKGWSIKAVPVYDEAGWEAYCRKDTDDPLPNEYVYKMPKKRLF